MFVKVEYQIRNRENALFIATYETGFNSAELALSTIAMWNRNLDWLYTPFAISYLPAMDLEDLFPNTKRVL